MICQTFIQAQVSIQVDIRCIPLKMPKNEQITKKEFKVKRYFFGIFQYTPPTFFEQKIL